MDTGKMNAVTASGMTRKAYLFNPRQPRLCVFVCVCVLLKTLDPANKGAGYSHHPVTSIFLFSWALELHPSPKTPQECVQRGETDAKSEDPTPLPSYLIVPLPESSLSI